MGLIRFLLAWSVVIFHSKSIFGLEMVHGGLAVEAFFVISGFYMSLILHEKYPPAKGSYLTFIINRVARLFPSYWIVIFVGVAANLVLLVLFDKSVYTMKLWEFLFHQEGWRSLGLVGLSNVLFLGQEVYQLSYFSPDLTQSVFAAQPAADWICGKSLLMLPQAWSISVELQFYFLAPFLVRARVPIIIMVLLGSLALRFGVIALAGWEAGVACSYYLFPTQLCLFLLGSLGYRVYILIKKYPMRYSLWGAWLVVVLSIVLFQWMPGSLFVKEYALIMVVGICVPFVFLLTKNMAWDRELGELSYPIYICHVTIAQFSDRIMDRLGWSERGLILSLLVFAVSWLLYRYVDHPLDNLRQRWVQRRLKTDHGSVR